MTNVTGRWQALNYPAETDHYCYSKDGEYPPDHPNNRITQKQQPGKVEPVPVIFSDEEISVLKAIIQVFQEFKKK